MSNNPAIDVFLRIRPTTDPAKGINVEEENSKISFHLQKDPSGGYVNNTKQRKIYQFNQVFDMSTKQGKVFDRVAKDVVQGALQGYNGTVFAYGQTGSGKTYTMTGTDDDFQGRGIIPRTFDYLFKEIESRTTETINVYASFIQIYNMIGYDLCPEGKDKNYKKLEDLQKIVHRQDSQGQTHLINLTVHQLKNRTQAFGMLMEGDTNRMVCKTPMNDESTRSHCIFKIMIESRKNGSDIKTTSTIHLVDLSGSERIKNTNVTGEMQYQARSINLTLHYLERVITCLNQKMRGQNIVVPYRESLLTLILKNSLGGNCRTKMIATISAKQRDIPQTISTLEFARRIANIKNNVQKNESVDPKVIITKLRNQNIQLKAELALLKGEDQKNFLDQYDIQDCHKKVDIYLNSLDSNTILSFNDRLMVQQSYSYLKSIINAGGGKSLPIKQSINNVKLSHDPKLSSAQRDKYQEELKKLRLINMSQQQEIVILLTEIKKYSNASESTTYNQPYLLPPSETQDRKIFKQQQQQKQQQHSLVQRPMQQSHISHSTQTSKPSAQQMKKSKALIQRQQIDKMLLKPYSQSPQQMLNNAKLCDQFRKSYKKQDIILKNQALLKQKVSEGKQYSIQIKKIKQQINQKKNVLQQLRQDILIENMNNNLSQMPEHPQQAQIVTQINQLRSQMKSILNILRGLKSDADAIQQILKKNKETYERDLQKYLDFVYEQRTQSMKGVDRSLLIPSVQQDAVHKALLDYQNKRRQIRKR